MGLGKKLSNTTLGALVTLKERTAYKKKKRKSHPVSG